MELAAEYRRQAEEVERLAENPAIPEEHRRVMMEMARIWRMMADQREARVRTPATSN
jgi:hypothetical protein